MEHLIWPIKDDSDTRVIREKIVEQQRADPLLKFIIAKLETKRAVQAGLTIPPLQESTIVEDHKDEEKQQRVDGDEKHQSNTTTLMLDDEDTEDDEQFSKQAKFTTKQMAKMVNLRIDRYRLVGQDSLLVKACVYRTAKLKTVTVDWPIVLPESMIPTTLSLFHGDKSIIEHGGKHKTYGALRRRFVWKGMVQNIRQWIGSLPQMLNQETASTSTPAIQRPPEGCSPNEPYLH